MFCQFHQIPFENLLDFEAFNATTIKMQLYSVYQDSMMFLDNKYEQNI